ncbi:MAG TPA: cell division protein ZipA C-terminal FtsZ-binding domain-containing protein [Steroidobacteraceae bacterium]|jgi:cell division protein ZipA|nr:cell division protein ZipA C-terminal FtsZ-binding domain-containing protein [Steroidobacteraceae bacterium]
MSELRLILLVAGLLFIAGIAGFEWWRGRRARALSAAPREDLASEPPASASKPLPDIHVVREPRVAVQDNLPVIELASTSASGTRRALGISISDEVAVDATPATSHAEAPATRNEPYIGQDDEISEVRVFEEQPVRGPQLVIAWPKENERRIVTLRVIPQGEPRFAGRALRQAFASAGFWHGPMDIYHLPDARGRVIVSAAALAQPGTFDPSIMDSQRFSGLNLFSVLPGVLSERETFDELVGAARMLAERLGGSLTDQHGDELTAQRIARLRQSLEAPAQARAAGES